MKDKKNKKYKIGLIIGMCMITSISIVFLVSKISNLQDTKNNPDIMIDPYANKSTREKLDARVEVDISPTDAEKILQEDYKELSNKLVELTKDKDIIKAIKDLDSSDQKIKGNTIPTNMSIDSIQNLKKKLYDFTKNNQAIQSIYIGTEGENLILIPENANKYPRDPRLLPWYVSAKKNDKTFNEVQTQYNDKDFSYIIYASIPIKDADKFIGALGVNMSVQYESIEKHVK